MADAPTLDIDHLRSWIGREDTAAELVTAELVRRFCATFDEDPGAPLPSQAVPRLLHWCLAQPAAPSHALGPDGHPARGGFLPPVPLPRRMWASGRLAFHGEIRVGDTMRRISRIESVEAKAGRTGALCFVTVRHEIDVDGRPTLSETQHIVYRGLDAGGPPAGAPEPAAEGAFRRAVDPSPPLLFRYSALTFNGHRIHYDDPYVTQVEGYPGLVVHGPLQATLLYRFATEIRGAPPVRFSFRGLSPAFANVPLFLNAEEDAGKLTLWTARAGGPVAMQAEAEW
ncbi:MaoC family dehydratase N-terminal domain-containing protein [Xanthobacter dioxanivorans]|uniref:MaoC family dehydratase N-terminal domain-containing protein n=1 Tax=Xanthobacter dioxanivorans TaxID=2528964 RepID=A0A974SIZ7_9HYPH|nr:MaoC family dehydratase N-terminal domain-containing protein [Xanthobacter dioxanivorans]QRG06967.1 MaoC family dehydratase N-terminal domain-containing protein [Xanthobacter dioxanivorans]